MADNVPGLMAGIGQAMRHLSERQRVVSQNIANSETPGYKSREVEAPNFSDLLAETGGGRSAARGMCPEPRCWFSPALERGTDSENERGGMMVSRDVRVRGLRARRHRRMERDPSDPLRHSGAGIPTGPRIAAAEREQRSKLAIHRECRRDVLARIDRRVKCPAR